MNLLKDQKLIEDSLLEALLRVKNETIQLELSLISERTIVGRIAHHLASIIESNNCDLNVDVEYTIGFDSHDKRLSGKPEFIQLGKELGRKVRDEFSEEQIRIIPDIIIHRRGPDGPNLAVVEVKMNTCSDSKEALYAKMKLKLLKEFPFDYHVGVFLNLPRSWDDFAKKSNWLLVT